MTILKTFFLNSYMTLIKYLNKLWEEIGDTQNKILQTRKLLFGTEMKINFNSQF